MSTDVTHALVGDALGLADGDNVGLNVGCGGGRVVIRKVGCGVGCGTGCGIGGVGFGLGTKRRRRKNDAVRNEEGATRRFP
eukprot:scaffold178_cov163-Amphora_coffeaeformis.AAC.9